jgi:hypothetical protein
LGSTAHAAVMEAPRRPGSVYGEEYRLPQAQAVAHALRHGQPIPPPPTVHPAKADHDPPRCAF